MILKNLSILKNNSYRYLWTTNLFTNFAIWMQSRAVAISVTHLSTSAYINSLVQWSITMPFFVFCILAGIIGDHYQKNKLLSFYNFMLCLTCVIMGVLGSLHILNIISMLIGCFIFGSLTACRMPISMAIISELVPKEDVKNAAILNSLAFNLMRAIGPALAGFLAIYTSIHNIFFIVAILLLFVSVRFLFQTKHSSIPVYDKQKISFKEVSKIIFTSKSFVFTSIDAFCIFGTGGIIWALMPYFAKYVLGMNSSAQGGVVSLIGSGAVITWFVLPNILHRLKEKHILMICYISCLFGMALISITKNLIVIYCMLVLFGFGWATAVAFFNGIIQTSFSSDILTRVVSFYLMIMYLSQAIGSMIWGLLSNLIGVQKSISCAAVFLLSCFLFRLFVQKLIDKRKNAFVKYKLDYTYLEITCHQRNL